MARLKIPKKQLSAIASLAVLPEDRVKILGEAIERTAPTLNSSAFFKNVGTNATGMQTEQVEAMVEALCGLSFIKESKHLSISDLTTAIVDAALEANADEFNQIDTNRDILADRLSDLLQLEKSLGVTAKALNVMTDYERIFCGVRILSDMRPVFTSSAESASAGFVVHNLSIHFHENGEHKEFFVALDNSDLDSLKDAIARAEKKTGFLRTAFQKAEITYLDVE
jgi:hypothetical protein